MSLRPVATVGLEVVALEVSSAAATGEVGRARLAADLEPDIEVQPTNL